MLNLLKKSAKKAAFNCYTLFLAAHFVSNLETNVNLW